MALGVSLAWSKSPQPSPALDSAVLKEQGQDPGFSVTPEIPAGMTPPAVGEGVEAEDMGEGPVLSVPGTTYGEFRLGKAPIVVQEYFPADDLILERARFWFHIYAVIGESEGLIHDTHHLGIIYRRLQAPGAYTRQGRKRVEGAIRAVQSDLRALAEAGERPLSPGLKSLKAVIPADWDSTAMIAAAERLRFQRGLRERFLAGIGRSHRWLSHIESTMVAHGLPKRIQYLPHVESSFLPSAYSKVGAAGMWQFMKGTARQYGLKATYLVDERRDPRRSTEAAARLLRNAHGNLQSWPLALTGYNHGPAGVARAVREVGSRDLGTLIRRYESRSFGFASGNFYAEFLAASSIAMLADSLFPALAKDSPKSYVTVVLPKATGIQTLLKSAGLKPAELEEGNLFLRPAVFRGRTTLPKGLSINLPVTSDTATVWAALRMDADLAASDSRLGRDKDHAQDMAVNAKLSSPADKAGLSEKKPRQAEDPPRLGPSVLASTEERKAKTEDLADANGDFALLTADPGEWGHPYDRFDPQVYRLAHSYSQGLLRFTSGPEETLSHYAEWSGMPMAAIRKATRLRGRKSLGLGRPIQLSMTPAQAEAFVRHREENYRAVEEDFYGSYHVSALEQVIISRGMSVWSMAMDKELPFWLLQKHNRQLDLAALHPGDKVSVPVVETGMRRWGFTRYSGAQEQLQAMARTLEHRQVSQAEDLIPSLSTAP